MPSSAPLALNFGVEFEFYVAIPTDILDEVVVEHRDACPVPSLPRCYQARGSEDDRRSALRWLLLAHLEDDAGIPIATDDSRDSRHAATDPHSLWELKDDSSIKLPSRSEWLKDHEYFTFELVSRVLPLNDLEYVDGTHPPKHSNKSGKGLDEVRRVLKLLTDPERAVICQVNESCGMHVHCGLAPSRGKGPGKPYKLSALQNLSALVTVFERYVDLILNDDRKDSDYCQKPSKTEGLRELDLKGRLAKIYATEEIFGIQEVMNPNTRRYHAINLQNIKQCGSMTVEWRQHHGTLNPDPVTAWVQVVAGFMRTAHTELSQERLTNWRRRVDQNDMTPSDFLRKIGKDHLVEYYRGVRRTKSAKPKDRRYRGEGRLSPLR